MQENLTLMQFLKLWIGLKWEYIKSIPSKITKWFRLIYYKRTNKRQRDALKWMEHYIELKPTFKQKLKGRWLRLRSKYMSASMHTLERWESNGAYTCPECGYCCDNDKVFEDHISDVHGYPRDMDIERFYSYVKPEGKGSKVESLPKIESEVMQDYLKYL